MSFITAVRRYQLSPLEKASSALSRRLWNNAEPVAKLSRLDSSRFIAGGFKEVGSTYLTPWFLVDVQYHAIVNSSDFALSVPSENDFLSLYNDFLKYDEELSLKAYDGFSSEDKFFYILFGLSQKTFWFQERHRLLEMNSRLYQMLNVLPRRHPDLPQFFHFIEDKYRCSFEAYNVASVAIVWIATHNESITFPYRIASSAKLKGVDNVLLDSLLQDYVCEYGNVRESTLEEKQLYLTPVLRSTQNELLISSAFLTARKAFTNAYWETRRLCLSLEGAELNLSLGVAFERYVDELLESTLPRESFERLSSSQTRKQADLIIWVGGYRILVEQKFAMLNIALQGVIFDLERADSWLSAYVQAVKQLQTSEEALGTDAREVVKLILFFDNLYIADGLVKERVGTILRSNGDDPNVLRNVFMIGIDEFERLVQAVGRAGDVPDKIFAEKIRRQEERDHSKGVEFSQIMDELSVDRNTYIERMSPFGNSTPET